jgi:hypothetical protein
MFDLEQSIIAWHNQMLAAGLAPATLDELESHLREVIAQRLHAGFTGQFAFDSAVHQVGGAELLKNEFAKVGPPFSELFKQFALSLTGIPNHQLVTVMNTTDSNSEPRWATYARGGTFVFPALFLWLFTAVCVLPKVNQLCQASGTKVFDFSNAPAVFRATAGIGQGMVFLTAHCFLIGAVVALAFFLLERYFTPWPRYRRVVIGSGVFALNAVVLLSLTTMIISVLLAAPALLQHAK